MATRPTRAWHRALLLVVLAPLLAVIATWAWMLLGAAVALVPALTGVDVSPWFDGWFAVVIYGAPIAGVVTSCAVCLRVWRRQAV